MSSRRRLDPGGPGSGALAKRNKRGTPLYSHEDIREQYCINDKELHALEATRKKPIFGCLTARVAQPSPCRRKSLLSACLRTRAPSEDNVYGKPTSSVSTSPSHRKQPIDYEDESYFKRRPKTICYTDPKKLATLDDSLAARINSRPRADSENVRYDNKVAITEQNDTARRPTHLTLASGEYHSAEVLQDSSDRLAVTVERTSYTQPNTPELSHASKVRGSPQHFLDDRGQQKHVSFQQKSISQPAAAVSAGVEKSTSPVKKEESPKVSTNTVGTKTEERLLDGSKSPEYQELKTVESVIVPIATKALLQEKLKRACMRTQATQTDTGLVRKSLPHLAISPRSDKTEMVSQAAQTNGSDGRRRLVKSLSEATPYEGTYYEIYDLDDLPPPPPPPQHKIPPHMPLYPNEYSAIWQYSVFDPHVGSLHNGHSTESVKSEVISRCRRCYSRPDSDDELIVFSPTKGRLIKTMSEGEILQEKRRCLGLASGYVNVDINGDEEGEEKLIEPLFVDECSFDLSHSHIFSQESLGDDTDEDVFHEHLLCPTLSRQSSTERRYSYPSDSELRSFDPVDFQRHEHLKQQLESISPERLKRPKPMLPVPVKSPTPLDAFQSAEEISPVEVSCITDSIHDMGDHLEESVSESQVTVLQKLPLGAGSTPHNLSDLDNGNYYLNDNFSDNTEENTLKLKKLSLLCTSNLSSISDEQTSVSENVISENSHLLLSQSTTPSDMDRNAISSADNDFTSICSTDSLKGKTEAINESNLEVHSVKIIDKLARDITDSQSVAHNIQVRVHEIRKLASPESDSSSSHFTEQETSKSPASAGTNTVTSRSDLSRTDSHPNTDQSETSEDYITATETSNGGIETRKEERFVSSPPRMDDILEDEALNSKNAMPRMILQEIQETSEASSAGVGHSSDFETVQDLTSPDGDTTTSASYHIEVEEGDNIFNRKEKISPIIPQSTKEIRIEVSPDLCEITELLLDTRRVEVAKAPVEPKVGAVKKRYSSGKLPKDDTRRYSKYLEDSGEEFGRRPSLTEEEREKLKLGMKLEFPPGVTMFGSAYWEENLSSEEEKKTKLVSAKPKKTVKIDLGKKDSDDTLTGASGGAENKTSGADTWSNRPRKQSDELSTPGMVRSPAMHEGFRVEDWTPVRTPGTPKAFMDEDSSNDESFSETKSTTFKSEKRTREKHILKEDAPKLLFDSSILKSSNAASEYIYKEPTEFYDNKDIYGLKAVSTSSLRANSVNERGMDSGAIIEVSVPYKRPPMVSSQFDLRRRSGDLNMMTWQRSSDERLRADEHLLGPGDNLRKADSLRSFSPGSDNVFLGGSNEQIDESKSNLCTQCGERPASREGFYKTFPSPHHVSYDRRSYERDIRIRSTSHRARSEERTSFTKDWGMTAISLELGDVPRNGADDDERGLYSEAYCVSPWLYVGPNDELMAWRRDALPPPFIPPHARIPGFSYPEADPSNGDDSSDIVVGRGRSSPDSTCSERDFRTRYQAITHRLIHRKASVEMYRRIMCGVFQTDKTVYVLRDSGEFGFRIHGSRPVVVSAIEATTPAETSGLEVGDIVMAINEVNVLDASHSEVVKLAHSGGSDTLRLDVARTCDVLTPLVTNDPTPICAGYLYKLGGAHHPTGSSSIQRKWRRRWFALKKDHCLYYYKSEVDQTPLGAVHLLDYSVHALVDGGRPYAFTVAKFGGTTLHLAAKTEEARNRWGQVLTQAALQAAQRDELIEESARRVQQSPGAIASPDCFGYLSKLGLRWHQWKRRYCVLKDACLYLYHDTDATNAIGVVHLHGYRVQSTSIGGKKFAFELIPPELKFRHFYFCTDSDYDMKRWLAGLEYSIDRWIKVG